MVDEVTVVDQDYGNLNYNNLQMRSEKKYMLVTIRLAQANGIR
jgi:hypothetical protein